MKSSIDLGGNVRLRGDLSIEITDVNTGRTRRHHVRNTITYAGLNSSLYLWAQDGITPADYQIAKLRPGTNSTPPSRGDVGVIQPMADPAIVLAAANRSVIPATGELVINATLGTSVGNEALPLCEVGLLLANNQLFARQVHPAFLKTSSFTLTYTWRIAVTA
jgi:hypothetical protein